MQFNSYLSNEKTSSMKKLFDMKKKFCVAVFPLYIVIIIAKTFDDFKLLNVSI